MSNFGRAALHLSKQAGDVSVIRSKPASSVGSLAVTLAVVVLTAVACASPARAGDLHGGYWNWWLPPDRSTHGAGIDSLFNVTFWITMVTFIAVEIALVVFLIKYRHRPEKKKAVFTHGNTRLEMAWTLAPALILAGLAIANKGVWDRLRFNPEAKNPDKATILVIGQQFKWNVIYPGNDNKLGRYMIFPKPTDQKWPGGIKFAGVAGPAQLKYDDAVKAINSYIDQQNPLGKDLDDPDGKDDNWEKTPGREIVIPADRPVEVQLGSKDVIHSFFLPNHRVKLDAVPGMRGQITFTATMTSKEREQVSRRTYKIDELERIFSAAVPPEMTVVITKDSPGAFKDPKRETYLYVEDPKAAKPKTIIRTEQPLTQQRVEQLKKAGIPEVTAYEPGYWELICEELCGQGHYTMTGRVVVLESEEYREKFQGGFRPGPSPVTPTPPTTQPNNIAAVTP
jgi:cytochrome c oxidase subunit 2